MSYFDQQVDFRELAYSRVAYSTLEMLRSAVARREAEGETRSAIAAKIGIDRSQLSRTLNGSVKNMTLRTISDIMFATSHSPKEFEADAWEDLSQAWSKDTCYDGNRIITIFPKSTISLQTLSSVKKNVPAVSLSTGTTPNPNSPCSVYKSVIGVDA